MSEYTKGEWKIDYNNEGNGSFGEWLTIETDEEHIVDTTHQRKITKEDWANAYLIAAAPDLLEACEAQHQAIDRLFAMLIEKDEKFFPSKSGQPWEAIQQGNSAIAKATRNA